MPTSADLLSRVRILLDDTAGSKPIVKENLSRSILGNQVGSGNTKFKLNNSRIASTGSPATSTLLVSKDGGAYAAPATEDDLRGVFTLASAPTASCFATYDWLYFTDDELTDFLTQAGSFVGYDDITQVPTGLLDALVDKAASDAALAISARRTGLYNAGAGSKTAQKGEISKKYADLSKTLFQRAVDERKAYYGERKGQASSPAYGKFATKQTPWTPRR